MQRVETYYGFDNRLKLDRDSVVTRQTLRVAEWHLYGSSRLGIYKTQDTLRTVDLSLVYKLSDVNIAPTQTLTKKEFYSFDSTYSHHRGDKLYEGSNHLGNVLVTFSDKRLATCTEGQVHYQADVRSATDYAAFGALLDDRQWYSGLDSGVYRYGYQGSNKDLINNGEGNTYSTLFRLLDPRLARWLTIDPKANSLPRQSPYCSMDNNPIFFNDQLGDSVRYNSFGDKINVLMGRLVSRSFRERYKSYKNSLDVYTFGKNHLKSDRSLLNAESIEVGCRLTADGVNYSLNDVYYRNGLQINDISNPYLRTALDLGIRIPLLTFWSLIQFPVAITSGIFIGSMNLFRSDDRKIGWGWANTLTGSSGFHLVSWGLGNYNKFNLFGVPLERNPFGSTKIMVNRKNIGLLGLRMGMGKSLPINFIDVGKQISFDNKDYYHFHINLVGRKIRRKFLSGESVIDFYE